MRWSMLFLVVGVMLLLLADVLAFHDLFEPHTARDWLMLAGSVLAALGLAGASAAVLRGGTTRS